MPELFIGLLATLAATAVEKLIPWYTRYAIDVIVKEGSTAQLVWYVKLIIGFTLCAGALMFASIQWARGAAYKIDFDLRNRLFQHIQTLSPSYFQRMSIGDVMARATQDINALRIVASYGLRHFVRGVSSLLFALGFLLALDVKLALVALLPILPITFVTFYCTRLMHDRSEKVQQNFAQLNTFVQENLQGIRVIKAHAQEEKQIAEFRRLNDQYLQANLSRVKIEGGMMQTLTLLSGLGALLILWYGGSQVLAGQITVGTFVAFHQYLGQLIMPLRGLGSTINYLVNGAVSAQRVGEILREVPLIADNEETDPTITVLDGEIEFRNLTFTYPGGVEPVLKNISLHIPKGTTLAIVGQTGAGKTTLLHLLLRLYPVEKGQLFLDGEEIHRIPLTTIRGSIGYAPQDSFLFSDTIRNNIAYGKPALEEPSIRFAAEAAQMLETIEHFPQQFATRIGERGITLSGGQKQRTSLARSLALSSPILLLDDTLASVDTKTENDILKYLREVRKGRTTILVSHRLSTIKDADHIVVLQGGQIVEEGTHETLLAARGVYYQLDLMQRLQQD